MGSTASILGIPWSAREPSDAAVSNTISSPISSESASPVRSDVPQAIEVSNSTASLVPAANSPQVATPVPIAMLVTPRRRVNMLNCVSSTPQGDDASKYPYYCPLCMEHFQDILEARCCGNYICLPCCLTFVQSKGIGTADVNEMLARRPEMSAISCPHCNTDGFKPELVALDNGKIRDYSMGAPANPESMQNPHGYSPLKVGESFENMKRKMIPLTSGAATTAECDPLTLSGGIAFPVTDVANINPAFSTANSTHELAGSTVVLASPCGDPADGDENDETAIHSGNISPTRLLYGENPSQPSSLRPSPRSHTTMAAGAAEAYVNSIMLTAVTGSNHCSRMVEVAH